MNSSNLLSNFSILDFIVIALVFTTTSFSIRYGKRKKNLQIDNSYLDQVPASVPTSVSESNSISVSSSKTDKYFFKHIVMGRTLTLPLFIATLVASWYGGIFGVTEISFSTGIYSFVTQGVFWYLAYFIFACFVVKTISRYAPYTFPQMIGSLFGPRSSKLSSYFNLFNVLPISYALSLGLFIQTVFGLNLYISTAIGAFLVCSYTIKGGMIADVYSDLIHFIIMCVSVLLVVIFAYNTLGDFSTLHSKLPSHYFRVQSDQSVSSMFMWLFLALATLVNPSFYQKCFATSDYHITRKGIFIAILIWMVFDCCTVLGGMYAKLYYDSLINLPSYGPKSAYLMMSISILPSGLKGLFVCGILATIISTLDSNLLISSNTLCYDLISKKHRSIWFQRLSVILVTIVSVGISFIFNGSVKEVWRHIGSLISGSLTIPVFLGLIKPHLLKDNQFVITVCLSFLSMIVVPRFIDIEMIFVGISCSSFLSILFYIINKLQNKTRL